MKTTIIISLAVFTAIMCLIPPAMAEIQLLTAEMVNNPVKHLNPPQNSIPVVLEGYSVEDVKQIIAVVAEQEVISVKLLLNIAWCESWYIHDIRGYIDPRDRGVFQINSYHNPGVTDEQAFDPWFSTRWIINEIRAGRIWKWEKSRFCWDK